LLFGKGNPQLTFLQLKEFEKLIEELITMKTLFTGYEVAPKNNYWSYGVYREKSEM
jgi:hypothetical protein